MRCSVCNSALRLQFKKIEVDTLIKFYKCRNGHETIYKRFGKAIDINGVISYTDKEYIPPSNEPQRA